ncbi:MAG: hypothetical protein JWP78_2066 [Mucilaginibacter sp.]|nr:hypothetical protein [Mucilaginibacter sp.]
MKDLNIKVWPELTDYIPALLPIQNIEKKDNTIFFDFTNCHILNSSGLNLFLLQILKFLNDEKIKNGWYSNISECEIGYEVSRLNFVSILNKYSNPTSLFSEQNKVFANSTPQSKNISQTSFPIYNIEYDEYENRRKALDHLKEWIYKNLAPFYQEYDFILPQLASIINEIAKNSADHTNSNAFIGLDVSFLDASNKIKISFSIGDLGVGINQNIKNHLPERIYEKRHKFWDLSQTYREALNRGFTTKTHSTENKGLGMSLILDGAKGIGLNLSVFDANSRGILSSINSIVHSEIRKNFFNIGKDTGFFYYGELYAKKII